MILIKKLLGEPLLQFLIAGGLLFAAYGWLNRASDEAGARQVRIGEPEVQWLKQAWARQWHREPLPDELRGLVRERLREELLAREALELGLDKEDMIVRRRLAQKMAFLVQDTSRLAEPTEDELRRFHEAHPEQFEDEVRLSYAHLYFDRERRADAAADARHALAALSSRGGMTDVSEFGDRLLIDSEVRDVDEPTVAGQFGAQFAATVFTLATGAWHGPIESRYGLHLVRVAEARPARQRAYAEVRAQVLERWREQRQREDDERYFKGLLKKYHLVVDESVHALVGSLAGTQRVAP